MAKSSLRDVIGNSSIANIQTPAPAVQQQDARDPGNYSFQGMLDELNSFGTSEERNINKWRTAVQLADLDGSAKNDNDLRKLQDNYFEMLEPEEGRTARDYRGDNAFTDALDFVGGKLDDAYLAGGNLIDAAFDTVAPGAIEFFTGDKEAGQAWKDATTGQDFAIIPEIASDIGLMMIPGVGVGLAGTKAAIDSRDNFIEAATGVDRLTGEDLSAFERAMNLGAGTLNTGLNIIGGAGATKAAAKTLGKESVENLAKAEAKEATAQKALNKASKKYKDTTKGPINAASGKRAKFIEAAMDLSDAQKAAKPLQESAKPFTDAIKNPYAFNPELAKISASRMVDNVAARKAAAEAADGSVFKSAMAFLENPTKKAATEAAEKTATKAVEEVAEEAAEETAKKGILSKIKASKAAKKADDVPGVNNLMGILGNIGVGGVNAVAASGGSTLPEIVENLRTNIETASNQEDGLKRGFAASAAMVPIALGSARAARKFGSRTPYWAMRGAATGAATDDILGNRALPITPENQEIIEALNEFYASKEE